MDKIRRFCLALDLKENNEKINLYKKYHQNVWTDVEDSLRDSGIIDAKIYNTGNRLFMILDVDPSFSFEKKVKLDSSNPRVREWEELMWNFQKKLPNSIEGEKWILMEKIYDLNS